MAVSFQNDIMPLFQQFQAQMVWRLDLTSYQDVVANSNTIYSLISTRQMPPPPFEPLSDAQIKKFLDWMNANFPE